MDAQTTDLFHAMIKRCLSQEVAPYYDEWEAAGEMPRSLWHALGAAGLLGIDLDEQHGGSGADIAITQLALEELSRQGFGGLASAYNIHANIVMPYLQNLGTAAQCERWLPAMARGDALGAIAMTEPHAGSDLASMRTRAKRTSDGWELSGSKIFITNGQFADLVIVCAKTDPSAGSKGVSLFLVDTHLPGFSRGKPIKKIGQHASDTAELAFDQMQLPHEALLGEEGAGFRYLMQELPRERLGVGAQALGAVEGALALTLEYVQQRQAFGQRVADFQNTRFTLAEIKAQLDVARAYFEHCVEKYRQGTMSSTDAAILKLQLSELQCQAVDRCLQLFGGYGYTHEYPISRFYLDARVQTIYAGSSEIMKEVVARSLLGKVA
ncbi:acyl-CoA dehydrogenase family protein [Vreelandella neptunia]|jgi:acyl-CoA dehydrogenase|uniref:Acyl-CoA dehydrogenase family protein n=1 Tax=Vreelandella neptunia TaxID=115551 RepID=A0ABZ0YFT9_9GAMM|nr:acyl-CoA dehydrogenase family protein [Halomonas neptunia]MDN3560190.1 acyl-CoA dehydrogenase family protein [Halomonas neptunia]TDV94568.1 alkylation response protein AidB-like acyl-CoA dehydrogenase [Halomonas alkaliantarctica]WQH10962.1 acyl-CoA dehydrogenase family protein [Halomonas neptunia]